MKESGEKFVSIEEMAVAKIEEFIEWAVKEGSHEEVKRYLEQYRGQLAVYEFESYKERLKKIRENLCEIKELQRRKEIGRRIQDSVLLVEFSDVLLKGLKKFS
ncbi:MAG: hypothetical protein ISN28_06185 [Ectothiorhodospiraceae bacterium AqS1]|nr:hypothetical protein [Ectothiorhodospiraceae bacterium AqS1]